MCPDGMEANRITLLRHKGNFEYNRRVLERGWGTIIVGRKSNACNAADYVPCRYCLLYLVKGDMRAHLTNACVGNRGQQSPGRRVSEQHSPSHDAASLDQCPVNIRTSPVTSLDQNPANVGSSSAQGRACDPASSSGCTVNDGELPKRPGQPKPFDKISDGVRLGSANKKNACLFCLQKKSLVWRHQRTVHRDEREVKQILSDICPDGMEANRISLLRHKGNFEYNRRVLERGWGTIIVGRKSNACNAADYVPCRYCLLYLVKGDMRAHLTNACVGNRGQQSPGRRVSEQHSPSHDATSLDQCPVNIRTSPVTSLDQNPANVGSSSAQGRACDPASSSGCTVNDGELPKRPGQPKPFDKISDGVRLSSDNKKNACLFCLQKKSLVWRHQKAVHRNEREVKEILSGINSDEGKADRISLLRNKGNFEYNRRVLERGWGTIIVGRKSNASNAADYAPCPYCLLYLMKGDMKAHLTNACVSKRGQESPDMKKVVLESLEMRDGSVLESSDFKANVIARMHDDDIRSIICKDALLVRFGSNLHEKLGRAGYQQISQRLRSLGVLLKEAGGGMSDLIKASRFEEVVRVTQKVCGYNEETLGPDTDLPTPKAPSKARQLGSELRQLATLKKCIGLELQNTTMVSDAAAFLYLLNTYWTTRFSSVAEKCKGAKKYEKTDLTSFTSDLKTFTGKIRTKIANMVEKGVHSLADFIQMTKAVVARLLVLNNCRVKELDQILLTSWIQRRLRKREMAEEVISMGVVERKMFEECDVLMAHGKFGNKIPVLIPEDCTPAIQILVDVRSEFVSSANKYLFANPFARMTGHYSAGLVLKAELQDLTLECPELFMAIKLKQFCAAVSQRLEMGDLVMEILTRHSGHDQSDHREYREADATHELTRAAMLMMKLDDEGSLSKYSGLSLDEILELEDDWEVDSEDDASDGAEHRETEGARMVKRVHVRWSLEENRILRKWLEQRMGVVPKADEIRRYLKQNRDKFPNKNLSRLKHKLYVLKSKMSA